MEFSSDATAKQPLLGDQPYATRRYDGAEEQKQQTPGRPRQDSDETTFPPRLPTDTSNPPPPRSASDYRRERVATPTTAEKARQSQQHYQQQQFVAGQQYRPHGDENPDEPSNASERQRATRLHALTQVQQIRGSTLALIGACVFNIPQIIAVAVILSQDNNWKHGMRCDQPLSMWAAIYAGTLALQVLLAAIPLAVSRESAINSTLYGFAVGLSNSFAYLWFLYGNYAVIFAGDCQQVAPPVYTLSLALIILNYVAMFMPCLLLCCCAPVVFCCLPVIVRYGSWVMPDKGLDRQTLKSLPTIRYDTSAAQSTSEDATECPICIETFENGDLVRLLPCHPSHAFHARCVDDWFLLSRRCPVCRSDMEDLVNPQDADNQV